MFRDESLVHFGRMVSPKLRKLATSWREVYMDDAYYSYATREQPSNCPPNHPSPTHNESHIFSIFTSQTQINHGNKIVLPRRRSSIAHQGGTRVHPIGPGPHQKGRLGSEHQGARRPIPLRSERGREIAGHEQSPRTRLQRRGLRDRSAPEHRRRPPRRGVDRGRAALPRASRFQR